MRWYRVFLAEPGLPGVLPQVELGDLEIKAENSALAALKARSDAFKKGFVSVKVVSMDLIEGGLNDA